MAMGFSGISRACRRDKGGMCSESQRQNRNNLQLCPSLFPVWTCLELRFCRFWRCIGEILLVM